MTIKKNTKQIQQIIHQVYLSLANLIPFCLGQKSPLQTGVAPNGHMDKGWTSLCQLGILYVAACAYNFATNYTQPYAK